MEEEGRRGGRKRRGTDLEGGWRGSGWKKIKEREKGRGGRRGGGIGGKRNRSVLCERFG